MRRQQVLAGVVAMAAGFVGGLPARAQLLDPPMGGTYRLRGSSTPVVTRGMQRGEEVVSQALQRNPITAPYRIGVVFRQGKATLSGRVGTSLAHDAAVRTVIALGYPVRDDLTIDTSLAGQMPAPGNPRGGVASQPLSRPYVYPPSFYKGLDDPFYGAEPPLVTFPQFPGRAALAGRDMQPGQDRPNAFDNGDTPPPNAGDRGQPQPPNDPGQAPQNPEPPPPGSPLPKDTVEAIIDPTGVAVLRGVVKTMDERVGIGQKLSKQPGVTEVINLLEVADPPPVFDRDNPPPPPTPPALPATPSLPNVPGRATTRGSAPPTVDKPTTPVTVDGDPLSRRVNDSLKRRPALSALGIKTTNRDGVITLAGKVPTAYEAMLAYRAAEQVAGVHEVNDRLEFNLPDADAPNPLRSKGRPEDVEPYLLAQVRRQVGDLAHVDRLTIRGDSIEVRGTLGRSEDAGRVEAALRSIPLLRGYRLEPTFTAE